ncbi:MAG: Gfo/Idh/MocA family oxidoreductase [Thermoplasmatales archaeon]|nr:Gfo/Idh/MocA family oxidoreductase [Candidatus Thermoplasmatota archaeon]MCL6003316.1 Gfo/Idh/MocA family oxidoreductase [Candidatus Thermoplasmatota archaeon]MDA8055398.1 Gfo/Idh/MocA family oxidoreductase [Thermoplasmatales archaeon]
MDFGIISLGNHALTRVMPAIMASGSRITHIYSTDRSKGDRVSREVGAEYVGDFEKFVKQPFEAVYISSPNSLHFYHARMSFEAGKSVLLEKPVTLNVKETIALAELSRKKDLRLGIGFHLRFHPAVGDIRRIIAGHSIGEPMIVYGKFTGNSASSHEGTWWERPEMAGGGSVVGRGVHIFDSFVNMFGRRVNSVNASSSPKCAILDNTMQASFELGDGLMATCLSSKIISSNGNDMTIYGSDGVITASNFYSTSVSSKLFLNDKLKKEYNTSTDMYQEEVRDFIGEGKRIAGPEDAVISTQMHLLSQESACSGKVISVRNP